MTTSTSRNLVFYADDDPDDLQLVLESFNQYAKNVEVITASDGGQALKFFQSTDEPFLTPCLIILDINMPEINGKDLLVKIRQMERFADVPVVLFTTSTQPLDMMFAKKFNAGFVSKPLNVKQMELTIDQFIGHCPEDVQNRMRKP